MTDQFIESAFQDITVQLRALQRPIAWEYRFQALPLSLASGLEESRRGLNVEGAEGWEAVALTANKWASLDCLVLLKRPKK